jgi:hypothetical protein
MVGLSSLGTGGGGTEPSSKKAYLGLLYRCPPGMCMALFIGLYRFCFSCFCPNFERCCWGAKSRTSSVPVICQSVACPATSPCPPLVASSTVSMGDLAMVESPTSEVPTSEAWESPVLVTPGADGALQGAAYVEMDGAGPHLSDDVGGFLWDLVRHGASIDVPGSAAPSDAAPAHGSLCTAGPGVSVLYLPGCPSFPPPLIYWRWVGMKPSLSVHRSPPRRGCCMRCYLGSTRTSCNQFVLI